MKGSLVNDTAIDSTFTFFTCIMFSKATEYALRAVIYIAQQSQYEHKPGIPEIAKAIGSPRHFTAKILQQLTRDQRIIQSVRGPGGGFFMIEKAGNLPVKVILQAMDEDYILEKCVLGLRKCSEKTPCPMHHKFKLIRQQLLQLFDEKTIQQLADETKKGKSPAMLKL